MAFIGEKEIKTMVETGELTPGGTKLVEIEYQDGLKERLSKLMYDQIVSEERCSLEALRDKRCQPVVAIVMGAFREWGVKVGELNYISALLNRSIEFNENAATCALWSSWMPHPLSTDDVDMVTIDRVLKQSEAVKS